jgi:hypothetical protein
MHLKDYVTRVIAQVEPLMGDVIDEDTPEEQTAEEVFTLVSDTANELLKNLSETDRQEIISLACKELGYPTS